MSWRELEKTSQVKSFWQQEEAQNSLRGGGKMELFANLRMRILREENLLIVELREKEQHVS